MLSSAWAPLALFLLGHTALPTQEPRERLPGWNASFAVPPGWRVLQNSGRAAALTDTAESSAIFVAAGFLATAAEAAGELRAMFEDLHYDATPIRALTDTTIAGRRALVAHYRGASRAGTVEARAAVVFTTHGTGVTVLGLGGGEESGAVAALVARVAASVDAAAPVTNTDWLQGLAGHWQYVPPASAAQDSSAAGAAVIDESLRFDGRERFIWHSRTIVTVRVPGTGPFTAAGPSDSGAYSVVGNTLVLQGQAGRRALDISLNGERLSIAGRVFRRKG
jgi:hypothetical protein